MLDMSDAALVGPNYLARAIIVGVAAGTRDQTVRALFRTGPHYLEAEDNLNLTVRLSGTESCANTLPPDMAELICNSCPVGTSCDEPVLVFGDTDPGCVIGQPFAFAIGGARSYSVPWGNCAGWPQAPSLGGVSYYPNNFRVWIR
jgi:hypothetical protein